VIGKTIGNYRILSRIGAGGVGEVFEATDLSLGRPVAIKALRADFASEPKILSRFQSEARTLAQLNHPNIAHLYSLLEHDGALLMVMEFVEGQTFSRLVERLGRLDVGSALPLFFLALEGIGYAHQRGVIHRDVKGSNLMLSRQGLVKVMDFGSARALGSDRLTHHGHLVGTLQYMSPEQVRGSEVDARSDIYSLGILLYDLLTGRVPFQGANDYELMRDHVETPPPPPREICPELPEALERALLRALAKQPTERFATTGEFKAALAEGAGLSSEASSLDACVELVRELADSPTDTRVLDPGAPQTGATHVSDSAELASPTRSDREATLELARPAAGRRWRRPAALGVGAAALLLLGAVNWLLVDGGVPVAAERTAAVDMTLPEAQTSPGADASQEPPTRLGAEPAPPAPPTAPTPRAPAAAATTPPEPPARTAVAAPSADVAAPRSAAAPRRRKSVQEGARGWVIRR
jgi:serine/threonine-protein kinase